VGLLTAEERNQGDGEYHATLLVDLDIKDARDKYGQQ